MSGKGNSGRRRLPKHRVLSKYDNKSDAIRPLRDENNNQKTDITVGGGEPNTMILFCPTARQRAFVSGDQTKTPNEQHGRWKEDIYLTGYKERVDIASSGPFLWRRCVFWSYLQIDSAIGRRTQSTRAGPYYTRQMTPIVNTEALRNAFFEGTSGVDYTPQNLHMAPLNRRALDVVMDKTYRFTGQSDNVTRLSQRKHYFPGGRIQYNDLQVGSIGEGSPWSVPSRTSKGNLYILDIFSDANLSSNSVTPGVVTCSGKLYWSE